MRTKLAFLLLVLGTTALGQNAKREPVSIGQEPLYKLVLENPRARALVAEIPAGKTTTFHRHDADYVLITLAPATIVERLPRRPARTSKFALGETQLIGGGLAHTLTNRGATDYRALFVELLGGGNEPPPKPAARRRNPCLYPAGGITDKCPGTFGHTRKWKDAVITVHQMAPGSSMARHTHKGDHLAVAITPLSLKSEVEGRQAAHLTQQPGDVVLVKGGMTHTLTNTGQQPARFVTIEFE